MAKRDEVKRAIRKELDNDKFLGNYAAKTRDRIAGMVAQTLAKTKDPDFGKEITGPRSTGRGGIFNEETVDGIIQQKTAATISIQRLKKMRTDGQVQLGLTAIKAPVIGTLADVPTIEGDDPEVNAFVDTMLEGFWKSLVRSSMNGLDFGFLPHEKIFEREEFTWSWEVQEGGKQVTKEQTLEQAWVLTKLKDIDPEGVKIWVDRQSESFAGFTEKGKEVADIVPAPKAFVFTPEREFGNLYGKPRLIPPFEPWTTFTILEYFSNRYFERFGEPGIKVGHSPNPVQSANGTRETYPGELAAAAADAYKGNGIYLHPNVYDEATKQPIYTFDVITDDRRGGDWIGILDFHLKRILRALLIPERALVQDSQVGSLASAQAYQEHFIMMLQQIVESLVEHVNLYIIPEIIRLDLGADRAPAKLITPHVGSENEVLIGELLKAVLTKDENVRQIVDWTNLLIQENIPVIEKDEDAEPEPVKPPEGGEEESRHTTTSTPNTAVITVNSPVSSTHALSTITGFDKLAKGLMVGIETAIDKKSKPVWDKVLGYEKAMRDVAHKFLADAELIDGRMDKRKNEKALHAAMDKINKIKDDMLKYYEGSDAKRTEAYFDDFEELALEDVKKLAKLYGVTLPDGYAKAIREEKLARSFGGAGRSFLENILLAGDRAAPALVAVLMLAEDQGQVVDEVAANGAMVTVASTAFNEDADDIAWATEAVDKASEAGTAAGAAAVFTKAAEKAKLTPSDKAAAKAQAKKVSKLQFIRPEDTVSAAVDDWHMNRGYLTQTIEAPARGTYRWTLATVAAMAGWDVAKMMQNPKTVAQGTPSGLTEKYKEKVATLNRWDEIARVEKVKEPLKLYGFNRGTRSYWFYMPMEWAEKQGLDIDKAGGE